MTSTCGRSTSCSPVRPKQRPVVKGFSVKDILDLPSSKASSSSSLPRSNSSRHDLDSEPCLPGSYHSPAAVYYCSDQSSYPPSRWLPPPTGDLFSYSSTFCKYNPLSCLSSCPCLVQHLWHKFRRDWTPRPDSIQVPSMLCIAGKWVSCH